MGMEEQLSARQRAQYDSLESIAASFGLWDTGTGADGAHYAPASANPFKPELVGSKCAFYEPGGFCEIVRGPLSQGRVEPDAVCKLWIIPDGASAERAREELGTGLADVLNRFRPSDA